MRWTRFLRRTRWDAERARELESYLQLESDDNVARGMTPEAARLAAQRKLGNRTRIREEIYTANTISMLDTLARDIRYSLRVFRRHPTFAIVALLTLAIGVGANTAVFAVVNSVLLKPLPYPNADALVAVWNKAPGAPGLGDVSGDLRLSLSMYATYTEQNRVFEHVGAWTAGTGAVTGDRDPEHVRTLLMTNGTLQALAVPPLAGRWFTAEDQQLTGAPATAMLSFAYWRRRFGAAPTAVGSLLTIDNIPRQIVGIMPRGFRIGDTDADVLMPMRFDRSRLIRPGFGFVGIGRLKPGVTVAAANADIGRMLPVWLNAWPGGMTEFYEGWRITPAVRPFKDDVLGNTGSTLWLVMATIAIVLLIACANVTNLLLVRAEGRRQEIAVRAALGAGSWRLMRETLIESVVLSVLGGLLGIGVAFVALRFLAAIGPSGLPRLNDIALDGRALGFALAISLASGLLLGAGPSLRLPRLRIAANLQRSARGGSAGRQQHRTQNLLVVSQVALATLLLVSAGLMIRTFAALRAVEPGFSHPEELQITRLSIPASLVPDNERALRLQHELVNVLSAIPGVNSAALTSAMPMEGIPGAWDALWVEGKTQLPGEAPLRRLKFISPDLFRTLGARLIVGRDLTWDDVYGGRPVVVISENLAREEWGSAEAALGKRLGPGPQVDALREVIGVVADIRDNGVDAPAPPTAYFPTLVRNLGSTFVRNTTFVVRSRDAGKESLTRQMQEAVWSVNRSLPIATVQTMAEVYRRSLSRTTFTLIMLAVSGGMALALGVLGLYGVIAYAVVQRRREIGIRLALGERHGALQVRFLGRGLALTGAGLLIGLTASLALTRLMVSLLYGISPLDPPTYVAVALLLAAAAALASFVPARQVSAVPLVEVLAAQ